ncbi:hypothetical protein AB0O76_00910 [Streptomyces sp. NPDC086554]|uniref:hypothetical protein n=1 Tax=Streptomyces sp. NPDC086554 TaxID=3154864 RepID=UPI003441D9E9
MDVVYVDLLDYGLFMERPTELEGYKLACDYLRAQALDLHRVLVRDSKRRGEDVIAVRPYAWGEFVWTLRDVSSA